MLGRKALPVEILMILTLYTEHDNKNTARISNCLHNRNHHHRERASAKFMFVLPFYITCYVKNMNIFSKTLITQRNQCQARPWSFQLMPPHRSIYWRIAMVGKVFLIGDTEKSNHCLYKKANDNYTLCFTFHTLSGCTHSFTDHGQTLYNWSSHVLCVFRNLEPWPLKKYDMLRIISSWFCVWFYHRS